MSGAPIEGRVSWASVPLAVRARAEDLVGARILEAKRPVGGFAPSAAFHLTLANGPSAFFKGIDQETANEFMRRAIEREERVYRSLAAHLRPWAPSFHGAFRTHGWHVLLLEDLGAQDVPPWSEAALETAVEGYAAFHTQNLGAPLPDWPSERGWRRFATTWRSLEDGGDRLRACAALTHDRATQAADWIGDALPELATAAALLATENGRRTLLHLDSRSDNIRVGSGGLRLFDWSHAAPGPPELDVAAWAQNIDAEGGPTPERFVAAYARHAPLRPEWLVASVSGLAGYFCVEAAKPPVPAVPHLRAAQRRQLRSCLSWLSRALALPPPTWLE